MSAQNDTTEPGVEVTVRDLLTRAVETTVLHNDYVLVVAGSCHLAHFADYPSSGTHVLTVKGRRP